MLLICPKCGLSKEVESGQIPAGTVSVSCPACGERFPLPGVAGDFAFETEVEAAVEPTSDPGAVPVASAAALPVFAGFWQRVLAALLDSVLVTGLQLVAGVVFLFAASLVLGESDSNEILLFAVTWSFAGAVALGYYVVFTGHGGQTPGKMALRLKVVCVDGSEVGYGKAFYREAVGKFVSGLILGIGYLMVAFDERKQGLHDRMAGTYVVKL